MRQEIIREVEQFLYREARLLDERRFHEWLELFTDCTSATLRRHCHAGVRI